LETTAEHHPRNAVDGGGATVEKTAIDLGYKNVGSFITMFRKTLGASPAHYMAERSENR
jgi:methylphosphotriester-DNA--protein-cysteine methyltransferase